MGSPSDSINRLAQANIAHRIEQIEGFRFRQARLAQGREMSGLGLRRRPGEGDDEFRNRRFARRQRSFHAVREQGFDDLGPFGELQVRAGVHGGAIDAAVEDRLDGGAEFAVGAAKAGRAIHDRIVERRALAQRRRVAQQQAIILRGLGVRPALFENRELIGVGPFEIERRNPSGPIEDFGGETRRDVLRARAAALSSARPNTTRA